MKNFLCLISFLFIASLANSQSNLILFTENGEKFTAILNGLRQNDKPETNVKITTLNAEFYKLKVIFAEQALGEKNMNVRVEPGSETTYTIKKNNKGEYVLRLISSVPLAQAPVSPTSQTVVVYNQSPAPAVPVTSGTVTQQTTTTTTTTTGGVANPDNMNFNMGVNVGETGGGMNVSVSGMNGTSSTEMTTINQQTTTTTTTTTSSGTYQDTPLPPPVATNYLPGYNGPIGCPVPMGTDDFNSLKQTIKTKSFEDTKMTIAKQVVGNQCLFVTQVREIINLFSFEESKLDFAKFAYAHTYDVGNYFKINDAFSFESSTEELNEYIQSRK